MVSSIPYGSVRILASTLKPVVLTEHGFRKSELVFDDVTHVVHSYKAHANLTALLDSKDSRFLKGFITHDGRVAGERVSVLPNGELLGKSFSLFSPHLMLHDEKNDTHWDVIFAEPNGKLCYVYTQKKEKSSARSKFLKVKKFEKVVSELEKKLLVALQEGDLMALALYTLLKTYIRVGNESYYLRNGHKGLTTLQKKDISISGNEVIFDFVGKDGVPFHRRLVFEKGYIRALMSVLDVLNDEDFVFVNEQGRPLRDIIFEKAFEKYCGTRFYPHIVRSFYATKTVENFLDSHDSYGKDDVIGLYSEIADTLGHKKFSRKKNEWEICYRVTVAHYIMPELVERIEKGMKS